MAGLLQDFSKQQHRQLVFPNDKVPKYLVCFKYWTLMVYPRVIFPPNFIIREFPYYSLSFSMQ